MKDIYVSMLLQLFLQYVFSYDRYCLTHFFIALQVLLPAANLLQLTDVRDACCDFLKAQLHSTNCLGIRAFADMHSCGDLMAAAHSFAEKHFSEVIVADEFLGLPGLQVQELISSDQLTVPSEEKV